MEQDILIIDDDEGIRKLFSRMLRKAGYSVFTAASGHEAMTLLDKDAYRLILLDLKMPGMDGTDTLREIRKKDKAVPVYIVTGFENEYFETLKKIREDGIGFELLKKPIEQEQLLSVVKGVLSA